MFVLREPKRLGLVWLFVFVAKGFEGCCWLDPNAEELVFPKTAMATRRSVYGSDVE